uniref:DB domain-containing protein n=1 Tax=Meloidogyne hapla TaxID=6305 RepID=A0A1I8BK50_MELHA
MLINIIIFIQFILYFYKVDGNSKFVSNEIIEQGIFNCCNNKWSNCCRQRLNEDKHLICLGLKNELAIKMGICLEKYFYGNKSSIIERKVYNCCWQLSGEKCRQNCYNYLRAPTMPPEQKFTFTDECLQINNKTIKNEENNELE